MFDVGCLIVDLSRVIAVGHDGSFLVVKYAYCFVVANNTNFDTS